MKNHRFPLLASAIALATSVAVAGCGSRSTAPQPAGQPVAPPMVTPTPVAAAPYAEDERYRATVVDGRGFDPNADPKLVESYKAAMDKAHQFRPPVDMKVPDKPKVVLQTNRGSITLQLDAKAAPLHVKSFVYLAEKGFFDGTSFHRHADLLDNGKGFIIQGGDPLTKDASAVAFSGMGGPGYAIPLEKNALTHDKLVVAAARTDDPDSAGSGFYITQDAVPFLDKGDGYTVFGKVVAGREAALKLAQGDILQSVKVENAPQTAAKKPDKKTAMDGKAAQNKAKATKTEATEKPKS